MVGSLFKATLKQSSRALHWRGWEDGCGWDLRQALLRRLALELSSVAATCRGVTCAWPLLLARLRESFRTEAASDVRVCCTVQAPARITWPKHHPSHPLVELPLILLGTWDLFVDKNSSPSSLLLTTPPPFECLITPLV